MRPQSSNPRNGRRDAYSLEKKKNTIHKINGFSFQGNQQQYKDQELLDPNFAKEQYETAMELLVQNTPQSQVQAFKKFEYLCKSIKRLMTEDKSVIYLAENIVKTYWSLRNTLVDIDQVNSREGLEIITNAIQYFEKFYEEKQKITTKSRLNQALFYLLMANQQYLCKKIKQALISCDKSLKVCGGSKFDIEVHKVKVYRLKAKIYEATKDIQSQLGAIKNCLQFINLSSSLIFQMKEKKAIADLKEDLIRRKQFIESTTNVFKMNENNQHKTSLNKFRKRSISLKKSESQKQIKHNEKSIRGYTPENSRYHINLKKDKIPSVKAELSKNNSKKVTIQQQTKKNFFDLKKDNKKEKLKKKPLKLNDSYKPSFEKTQIKIFEEIQSLKPVPFNFEDLMLQRPRAKKQQKREIQQVQQNSKEYPTARNKEVQGFEIKMVQKQSEELYSQNFEPITHTINEEFANEHQQQQIQQKQIIEKVINDYEQSILKKYIKLNFETLQNQENDLPICDQNEEQIKQSNVNQQTFFEQEENNIIQSQHKERKIMSQNSLAINKKDEISQFKNVEFHIDQKIGLCTSFGYLSKFKITAHIYEKEKLVIKLQALLNEQQPIYVDLSYFYESEETQIQGILLHLLQKISTDMQFMTKDKISLVFMLISSTMVPLKKPIGTIIAQKTLHNYSRIKKDVQKYKKQLRQRFLIYQLNISTSKFLKSRSYLPQKQAETNEKLQKIIPTQYKVSIKQEQDQQFLNYYLKILIKKLTEDFKDDASNASSLKRIKTDFKNTQFSYKRSTKSIEELDCGLIIRDDQSKSLSLAIMPTNFRLKISNYFQNNILQKKQQTPFEQFYYCMKFVLIKPFNTVETQFIHEFYDKIEVDYLHRLKNNLTAKIKMTCLKPKQMFKVDSQLFFKFQLDIIGMKIKMMKFIATSKDLRDFNTNKMKGSQNERTYRNSKKFLKKVNLIQDELEYVQFKKDSLLGLLRKLSSNIFVKKDYIYNIVGFQNEKSPFSSINKFRLEGKTVQNRHFMVNHLKQINVIFQKSIKIKCKCLKEFAVLTVRKINYSQESNIYFYVPKLQKTFSVTLKQDIIKYLDQSQIYKVFNSKTISLQSMKFKLFGYFQQIEEKYQQRQLWNNFVSIFAIQSHRFMGDRIVISLKIGKYQAFLKDCSFSEYFELDEQIYYMQMSLQKKGLPISEQIESVKRVNLVSSKRKSSSSKQLLKQSIKIAALKNAMKTSLKVNKMSNKQEQNQSEEASFQTLQFRQKFNQIYENDADKYVLYITLSQLLKLKYKPNQKSPQSVQAKKIIFSFYLSNLCSLIKQCKSQLELLGLTVKQVQNEQIFSLALLQRTMTIIKYKIIKQLKTQLKQDKHFVRNLFEGEKTIQKQCLFKTKLNQVFRSQNHNTFTLNSTKKLHIFQKNNFLIYKNVMQLNKNELLTINFNQINKQLIFFIINNIELNSKHKVFAIEEMKMPFISFMNREELCLISRRIYEYYKNILLII